MVALAQIDPSSGQNRKLSLLCARFYCILLAIPGAKSFEVFDEDILQKCFQILNLPDSELRSNERSQFQLCLVQYLDDLCTVLKFLALDEYKEVKVGLVKALKSVLLKHHTSGFENICMTLEVPEESTI